jgi:hypothetical protein
MEILDATLSLMRSRIGKIWDEIRLRWQDSSLPSQVKQNSSRSLD